jgi:hypothetical protein
MLLPANWDIKSQSMETFSFIVYFTYFDNSHTFTITLQVLTFSNKLFPQKIMTFSQKPQQKAIAII